MKRTILLLTLIFAYQLCSAQLIFSPLYENRVIKEHLLKIKPDEHFRSAADTLVLPFFDDFSRTTIFPNSSLWLDRSVFINNTYSNYIGNTQGNNAPSINVATFDGFDDKGNTYGNNPNVYGYCDTLTSKPINLTPTNPNNPAADSFYLSFYIQPKGIGLNLQPERADSLLLQFKSPASNNWLPAASYRGYTIQEVQQGKVFPFMLKMIPITDTNYLKNGFQFRFINKGSLYGADDIWNIDYVKLNRGRSQSDSLLTDASFNTNPSSFLKSYTAVPFNQYTPDLIQDNHLVSIRNNFNINKTIILTYTAYNITNNTFIDSASRGISNVPSYGTVYEASEKFSFAALSNEAVIRTRYTIVAADDNVISNDSISLYTQFKDYFAYDDGSAEGGIGLKTTGDGRFAVEFELKDPDTLTSVRMYFNRFLKNVSDNLFTLTIWKSISLGSEDQEIVYQQTTLKPKYDSLVDGFAEFTIGNDTTIILPAGKFYVGWVQNIDYDLNLGFDQNTDNGSKIFYNVSSGGWQQANIYGAAMIRPVFKSVSPNTGTPHSSKYSGAFNVYPNPTNGIVNILYKADKDYINNIPSYTVEVFDLIGKSKMYNTESPESIDITAFEKGVYFMRLTDLSTKKTYTSKIIKY